MDEDASTADPERVDTTPDTLTAAAEAYAASNPGWNLQVTKFAYHAAKFYAENNAVGTKLAALATAVAAGDAPIDLIRPSPRAVQR